MTRCGFGAVACRLAMLTPPSRHMKVMQQCVAESRKQAEARREPAPPARRQKLSSARRDRDAFLAHVKLLFELPEAQPPVAKAPAAAPVAVPVAVAAPAAMPVAAPAVPAKAPLPGPLQRVPLKGSRMSEASTAVPSLQVSREASPQSLAELEAALGAAVKPRKLWPQLKRLSEEEEALQKSLLRMDFEEMKRQFGGRKALWRDELMGESFKKDPEREAKLLASLKRLDLKFRDLQQEARSARVYKDPMNINLNVIEKMENH